MIRRLCILVLISIPLLAERTMTVAQLTGFVKSSIEQKLDDRSVAETLKKTKLAERLTAEKIAEFRSLGAGPRTMAALGELSDASRSMPEPAAAAPKPAVRVYTAPDSATETRTLDTIREYALNYTQNLPNFICSQVTRRKADLSGTGEHWQTLDRLQEQLTYFEHRENYKVIAVNGQMTQNQDHDKLNGVVTSGEFGSMMLEIFLPETETDFHWTRLGKLDGRIMNVYDYRVSQPRSHYTIEDRETGRKVTPGYHGQIFANRDTNAVMRITLETDDIPRDFPLRDLKLDLWYDVVKISGQEFVLPLRWSMTSRDGRRLVASEAEYALYRKYESSSSITFDTSDADQEPKLKEEPVTAPVNKKQ